MRFLVTYIGSICHHIVFPTNFFSSINSNQENTLDPKHGLVTKKCVKLFVSHNFLYLKASLHQKVCDKIYSGVAKVLIRCLCMKKNYPNNRRCGRGRLGEDQPTCKMGTFFQIPLALTMPISNNFQLNGASRETPKL